MPHIHEKIDWTVEVYIVYKNKVLLRLHEKYKIWLGVGGHIELDEDSNAAAIREVKEEVGLDVELFKGSFVVTGRKTEGYRDLIAPQYMNIHKINDAHSHIALIYAAKSSSNKVIPESPDDKWMWLTSEEIDIRDDMLPDVKFYAKEALRNLR